MRYACVLIKAPAPAECYLVSDGFDKVALERGLRSKLGERFAQEVAAVNLVNQHGSEGVLCKVFADEAARLAATTPGFTLISFDFHKECGATSYHK